MRFWGIIRDAAALLTDKFTNGDNQKPNLTVRGNVAVEQILIGPGGTPAPTPAETDDGAIVAGQTAAFVIPINYVFDLDSGGWVRMNARTEDGSIPPGSVTPLTAALGQVFDLDSGTWGRLNANTDDGLIPAGSVVPLSAALNQAFNGTDWVRLITASVANTNPAAHPEGALITAVEPRDSLAATALGAAASVVVPAVAGTRIILDSVIASNTGAAAGGATTVTVTGSASGLKLTFELSGAIQSSAFATNYMNLAFVTGESVTVSQTGAAGRQISVNAIFHRVS